MNKSKYLFSLLLFPVFGAILVIGCANVPSSEITFQGHSGDQYSDPSFLLPGTVRIEWTPDSGTIVQHIGFQRKATADNDWVGFPPLFEFWPRAVGNPGSPLYNDGSRAGSAEIAIPEPASYVITASASGDFTVKITRISSNDQGASGTSNTGKTSEIASVVKVLVLAIPRDWDANAGDAIQSTPVDWDADAEDDGIVIYPELRDASDRTIQWNGPPLTVDIEIWNRQVIYRGSGTITSWKDGDIMMTGGIRVPYEQMSFPSDVHVQWARTSVKVHTPDGKIIEGVYEGNQLPP